ncbi:hypothetical protein FGG08_003749 [Glutinoglossum americanum]|uniref:Uncharacterized protein n=1 Tax=Glutinoglossum americanum TaxID=1670608 RepID=A0A9P8KXS3_9PEZI|nr:hypothetical protein FGG08_003749 [Glutinoglossum americanum]
MSYSTTLREDGNFFSLRTQQVHPSPLATIMAFGWSPSSILAAINFIVDVAKALDEAEGAGKEFREAISFLRSLDPILRPFAAPDANLDYKAEIDRQVMAIKIPVERFMGDVEGMERDLGVPHAGRFSHFRKAQRKLEWHYSTSKRAIALQREIQQHLAVIHTLMQHLTVDMLRALPSHINKDIHEAITDAFRPHASLLRTNIASDISQQTELALAALQQHLEERLQQRPSPPEPPAPKKPRAAAEELETAETAAGFAWYTPEALRSSAAHLAARRCSGAAGEAAGEVAGVDADPEVVYRLRRWWGAGASGLLWVQGPDSAGGPASLAGDVAAVARRCGVPGATHVCRRVGSDGEVFGHAGLFVDLLCSLVHQLVQGVAAGFSSDLDFGPARFARLDRRSPGSIPAALLLVRDLLSLQTGRQLVVLDGMQWLDYSNDATLERQLEEFLRILKAAAPDNSNPSPLIKTLITTSGQTLFLMDEVDEENRVDATRGFGSGGFFAIADFEEMGNG